MKKIIVVLSVIGSFCINPNSLTAQSNEVVFAEILGNGLVFSFNYDRRFTEATNGWGGRVGLGYIGSIEGDGGVLTIPVMINNLLGQDGKYFEIGGGITYLSANADFFDDSVDEVIGTFSFMYRKQPEEGGFMWKIGFTPILASGVFVPYYIGIGLGFAW